MNLYAASSQWSKRPDDERFSSLEEMYSATKAYADSAREVEVPFHTLRVEKVDDDIQLVSRGNTPATFTHYAFGQLCERISENGVRVPAEYLRSLPPTLAANNLNHGLAKRSQEGHRANLLFHENGSLVLRALTTSVYSRMWNYELIALLMKLRDVQGWRVPPARPAHDGQKGTRRATPEDVLAGQGFSLSVEVGDLIAPAGLYASDHDMFAFMINENARLDDGSPDGLMRGFFLRQSEVGECSVWFTGFKMRHVCGNHIVWGATDLLEVKLRHIGEVRRVIRQDVPPLLAKYANASASEEQAQINRARQLQLGPSKSVVIETVQKLKVPELSKKRIGEAYDMCEMYTDQDGSPRTVWGMVNGLTRLSQQTSYADDRNALDRAAGRVMKLAN